MDITAEEVRAKAREAMEALSLDQNGFALLLGISAQYLSDFLRGLRAPPRQLLEHLGYERVLMYRPKGRGKIAVRRA